MSRDEQPMIRALADAVDSAAFGGKAVQLGAAVRAGLPVPAGFAVSFDQVDATARGDTAAATGLDPAGRLGGGTVQVPVGLRRRHRMCRPAACGPVQRGRRGFPDGELRGRPRERARRLRLRGGCSGHPTGTHLCPGAGCPRLPGAARARPRMPHGGRGPGARGRRSGRCLVHPEPGHRRGRAGDRSELGARRSRRVRVGHPRSIPA